MPGKSASCTRSAGRSVCPNRYRDAGPGPAGQPSEPAEPREQQEPSSHHRSRDCAGWRPSSAQAPRLLRNLVGRAVGRHRQPSLHEINAGFAPPLVVKENPEIGGVHHEATASDRPAWATCSRSSPALLQSGQLLLKPAMAVLIVEQHYLADKGIDEKKPVATPESG